MSWSDDRWLGAAPSIGMRITCSATRSASCSYSSPGSLMRNFACADMPINFFFSHSSQVPDNPLDPPQAQARCRKPAWLPTPDSAVALW